MTDLIKINDDLFIPENFETNHVYFADSAGNTRYTGITSVISVLAKPALIGWAAKMATEYIKDASERDEEGNYFISLETLKQAQTAHIKKKEAAGAHGTNAHALVESYITECITTNGGCPVQMNEKYDEIAKFVDWAQENVAGFLFAERRMADKTLFIAGTADFGYISKDWKKYMADFKTSSGIYGIDYYLQVAAYRMLAETNGDTPYDASMIVRLGKDGVFETQRRSCYEKDKKTFLACLHIYRNNK